MFFFFSFIICLAGWLVVYCEFFWIYIHTRTQFCCGLIYGCMYKIVNKELHQNCGWFRFLNNGIKSVKYNAMCGMWNLMVCRWIVNVWKRKRYFGFIFSLIWLADFSKNVQWYHIFGLLLIYCISLLNSHRNKFYWKQKQKPIFIYSKHWIKYCKQLL